LSVIHRTLNNSDYSDLTRGNEALIYSGLVRGSDGPRRCDNTSPEPSQRKELASNDQGNHSTKTNALQRISASEFERAFTEYQQQRNAFEATSGQPRDWSAGNPLDALDAAFKRMVNIPAPDLDALARKMEATTGETAENCGWEAQYYVEQFVADARRLAEGK
jgi:hypothetical protein